MKFNITIRNDLIETYMVTYQHKEGTNLGYQIGIDPMVKDMEDDLYLRLGKSIIDLIKGNE